MRTGDAVAGPGGWSARGGVGEVIRRYRQLAGLSQEQLGERADLSVRAVRNLELDKVRRPRRSTLQRIGHALGLDIAATAYLVAVARTPEPALSVWVQLRPLLGQLIDRSDPKRLLVVPVLVACPRCTGARKVS
jgi:transcriptional regulator with XRE-family HTH domain